MTRSTLAHLVTRRALRELGCLDSDDVLSYPILSCCLASSDASKRKEKKKREIADQQINATLPGSKQNESSNLDRRGTNELACSAWPTRARPLSVRPSRSLPFAIIARARLLSQRDYNVTGHHLTTTRPTSNSISGTRNNVSYSLKLASYCRVVASGLVDAHCDRDIAYRATGPLRQRHGGHRGRRECASTAERHVRGSRCCSDCYSLQDCIARELFRACPTQSPASSDCCAWHQSGLCSYPNSTVRKQVLIVTS